MKVNVKTARGPTPHTHEGATAANISCEAQLRRSVMACLLWEDTFYEGGVAIAERIAGLVPLCRPDAVTSIARDARAQMKLRHVPLLLAREMARGPREHRLEVALLLEDIIQRADELTEFLAIYWKDKRQPLSAQVKKGLARAFTHFSEYDLAKYDRDGAVKLRDVLFLSHANPNSDHKGDKYTKDQRRRERETGQLFVLNAREHMFQQLIARTLETPDTWEVNLSAGADKRETFERLMAERKLGALAFLRNLRNMQEAGVSYETLAAYAQGINVERVLPFRFVAAARYAPTLEPVLESLMFKCVADAERLAGHTVLVVDNSGSMSSKVSGRSEMSRSDAACALAILLREICERCTVVGFGSHAQLIAPRRGFALRDAIQHGPGGGTNTADAIALAKHSAPDRIIVITDEQSHQAIPKPPAQLAYFVNVACYKNGIGYGPWTHIDGWSEAIVQYIQQREAVSATR